MGIKWPLKRGCATTKEDPKMNRYTKDDSPKVESLDLIDRLIMAAMGPRFTLPKAVLKAARVERCEFDTGHHDGAANGWKRWERAVAFRPEGYEHWYRPDLSGEDCKGWVADPLEGFRREDVHAVAPCHASYARPA